MRRGVMLTGKSNAIGWIVLVMGLRANAVDLPALANQQPCPENPGPVAGSAGA